MGDGKKERGREDDGVRYTPPYLTWTLTDIEKLLLTKRGNASIRTGLAGKIMSPVFP